MKIKDTFNFFYIFLILFMIYSIFSNNLTILNTSITLSIYFLFKWVTNYRKCTISYIECKLRGVKKEDGYLYRFLENIFNINKKNYRNLVYIIVTMILFYNLYKKNYISDKLLTDLV